MTAHTHEPDGAARVGTCCTGCPEAIADTEGTYDDARLIWTDGRITGRAL